MSATLISISNRSLLAIGSRSYISSLNEGSTQANAISTLFNPTFEALGRSAHWNCLRQQATLSLIAAAQGTPENQSGTLPTPPTPWLYSYEYPSNCLMLRQLVPTYPFAGLNGSTPLTTVNNMAPTWLANDGQVAFAVAYSTDTSGNPINIILTNQSQAQAIYTVNQPNPVIWDSMFQEAMVASLSAYLVPALNLNLDLMKVAIATADKIIAQARASDGNEGITIMDHVPDWLRARQGSGGYLGDYGGTNIYGGYSNMNWPAIL